MLNYYVDPGSGFVFVQNTSLIWGLILGAFGGLLFFFRFFFKLFKKIFWAVLIILLILAIGGIIMHSDKTNKKVIIMGIDAMDTGITEKLMSEGRLPNLLSLKSNGTYGHLATTVPSESIVAWSSFATGLEPAMHGVFDFVMCDNDYNPYLALNDVRNTESGTKVELRRKGEVFWDVLSKNRIKSYIYFCPNTFPAQPLLGKMLSGMGVPDLSGTMGTYSFYTTKQLLDNGIENRGKIINVKPLSGFIRTEIYGPKVSIDGTAVKESTIGLFIHIGPDKKDITMEFQKQKVTLKQGFWSNWQKLSFKIGQFKNIKGIARFYLKSVEPEFELYLAPINFDPENPIFPISYPKEFSAFIAKKTGLYYTQGMPHNTWGLSEERLDEEAFLQDEEEILTERKKILKSELRGFKSGLFFFYFDSLDMIQHMFWRYIDTSSPRYEKSIYQDTIYRYYEKMDRVIGDILKELDKNTTLIVLSDHGFGAFRRAVHLNRWLLDNGYLYLNEGISESKGFFEGINWQKTKAYALGFGGIYFNKSGRKKYGIVSKDECDKLTEEISSKLHSFHDPQNNDLIVKNVYKANDFFNGEFKEDAPDLFVGFNNGYRASWQTALGGVPELLIEDNLRKWSGDHLMDPKLVPGVIFMNKKAKLNNPGITDIAAVILELFGVDRKGPRPPTKAVIFQE